MTPEFFQLLLDNKSLMVTLIHDYHLMLAIEIDLFQIIIKAQNLILKLGHLLFSVRTRVGVEHMVFLSLFL